MTPGQRVKDIRKCLKIRQNKLAESIGISAFTQNATENGRQAPTHAYLARLASLYNVNVNWVLTGEGSMFIGGISDEIKSQIMQKVEGVVETLVKRMLSKLETDGINPMHNAQCIMHNGNESDKSLDNRIDKGKTKNAKTKAGAGNAPSPTTKRQSHVDSGGFGLTAKSKTVKGVVEVAPVPAPGLSKAVHSAECIVHSENKETDGKNAVPTKKGCTGETQLSPAQTVTRPSVPIAVSDGKNTVPTIDDIQEQADELGIVPMGSLTGLDKEMADAAGLDVEEMVNEPFEKFKKMAEVKKGLVSKYLLLKNKLQRGIFVQKVMEKYKIKRSTFYKWIEKYEIKGPNALNRKTRKDRGKARKPLDIFIKKQVQVALLDSGEWNMSRAIAKIQSQIDEGLHDGHFMDAESGEVIRPKLDVRKITECINKTKTKDAWVRKWHSKDVRRQQPSVSHSRGITPPCKHWQIDDHDQDLLTWSLDKYGELHQIRPKVLKVLDPELNMIMGWCLTDGPYGSIEIKKAILHAITRNGVIPDQIYLECDKRMRERGMESGLETFLGIQIYGTPYNSTAKASVEKSFNIDRLELDSEFESYISNNPINRPDGAEDRVFLDFSEYEKIYAEYVEWHNKVRTSVYRGNVRKTPVEMWNDWIEREWKPNCISDTDLEHLPYWMSKGEERTVRSGSVRFTIGGVPYNYVDILEDERHPLMSAPEGSKVTIRRHFENLKTGYVYIGEHPSQEMVGRVQLLEKIGYGYGEFTETPVIDLINSMKKMVNKQLKALPEELHEMQAIFREAEARMKDINRAKVADAKMVIPRNIIKFLPHHTSEPVMAFAKIQDRETAELLRAVSGQQSAVSVIEEESHADFMRRMNKPITNDESDE